MLRKATQNPQHNCRLLQKKYCKVNIRVKKSQTSTIDLVQFCENVIGCAKFLELQGSNLAQPFEFKNTNRLDAVQITPQCSIKMHYKIIPIIADN